MTDPSKAYTLETSADSSATEYSLTQPLVTGPAVAAILCAPIAWLASGAYSLGVSFSTLNGGDSSGHHAVNFFTSVMGWVALLGTLFPVVMAVLSLYSTRRPVRVWNLMIAIIALILGVWALTTVLIADISALHPTNS